MNEADTVAAPPRPPRARCLRCARPLPTCLCAFVRPVDNPLPVLVLQHPREAAQAKGSLPLLHLSLARCRVEVGEAFPAESLARWLAPEGGGRSLLLYPDVPAAPALALHQLSGAVPVAGAGSEPERAAHRDGRANHLPAVSGADRIGQLVVLDATWRKSLKLLLSHPLLLALPRLALGEPGESRYRSLRRAAGPLQRSTLEASCLALAALEAGVETGSAGRYQPLLTAFEQWVARQAAPARREG